MTESIDVTVTLSPDELARLAPPAGFEPLHRVSKFTAATGPFFIGHPDGHLAIGLRLDQHQLNFGGSAHGGFIGTLADIALSMAAIRSTTPPIQTVTVSLSLDFIGGSSAGDWIQCDTEVLRTGASLVFIDGRITANGKLIARASGVFKRLKGRVVTR